MRDAAQHLNRQEIFYARWNNGWSTPIRLTDDLLANGMPEFIGYFDGGVAIDGETNTSTGGGSETLACWVLSAAPPQPGPKVATGYCLRVLKMPQNADAQITK